MNNGERGLCRAQADDGLVMAVPRQANPAAPLHSAARNA